VASALAMKRPAVSSRICFLSRSGTNGKRASPMLISIRRSSEERDAGRRLESWSALEAHLDGWMREIADNRIHGTTGEAPIERFRRAEAGALRSIAGVPPFAMARELVRKETRKPGLPPLPSTLIDRVVALTLAEPPGEATHWTGRTMARPAASRFARCSASGRRTVCSRTGVRLQAVA
jgi:hypothetical protein